MRASQPRIALGFCNNVDYEIVWDQFVIEALIERYKIQRAELGRDAPIKSERDLLVSILGFMQLGAGAERFVASSDLIERFAARFQKRITLGGTSVRAAIALRRLGIRSALHLITQNDDARRLIPADSPSVCSNSRDSRHPHLILQFDEDARVRVGDIDIRASQPNRLIYHSNADRIALKINEDFGLFLGGARALLVSGFNAMQSLSLLEMRLASVRRLLERLPGDATVFLEDGGFHQRAFRQLIQQRLGGRVDVYSMNEDELAANLQRAPRLDDPDETLAALAELKARVPARAIVLHTRHWALAHGPGASGLAGALRAGASLATTRFRHGDDWTLADLHAIEALPPLPRDARFADAVNAMPSDEFYCAPVAEVPQTNATTIGLGDAFVGGFLSQLA